MKASDNLFFKRWNYIIKELKLDAEIDGGALSSAAHVIAKNNENSKTYFITKDAMLLIDKIKHNADLSVLKGLEEHKSFRIMFDRKGKENDHMVCFDNSNLNGMNNMYCTFFVKNERGISYTNISIDKKHWKFAVNEDDIDAETTKRMIKMFNNILYPTLLYVFLSDIEMIEVQPLKQVNIEKKRYMNDTLKSPFTVVGSKWNVLIVRNDDFGVSGHFRLQACGPGNQDRRLIYIKPFVKHGYKRRLH